MLTSQRTEWQCHSGKRLLFFVCFLQFLSDRKLSETLSESILKQDQNIQKVEYILVVRQYKMCTYFQGNPIFQATDSLKLLKPKGKGWEDWNFIYIIFQLDWAPYYYLSVGLVWLVLCL